MIRVFRTAFVVAGLAAAGLAVSGLTLSGAAMAQQAPASAAPKQAPAKKKAKAPPKNATEIVLQNARSVAVTGLAVVDAKGKRVASLKKPLDSGKKLSIKLPKGAGCTFTVQAGFADDAEFDPSQVDLCADKTVRFTD